MIARSELLKKQKSKEKFDNPFAKRIDKIRTENSHEVSNFVKELKNETSIIDSPRLPYKPSCPTSDGGIRP